MGEPILFRALITETSQPDVYVWAETAYFAVQAAASYARHDPYLVRLKSVDEQEAFEVDQGKKGVVLRSSNRGGTFEIMLPGENERQRIQKENTIVRQPIVPYRPKPTLIISNDKLSNKKVFD